MHPTSFYSPRSLLGLFLSLLLSVSLALAPIHRARAELATSSLGAMLGFRTAGAAGSAALAVVVGTGGAALAGIGLSLAAMYIYDKYVSPNATTPPSDPPVAQINLDNQSRPLTDEEKAKGFTNGNGLGQGVTPPNTSSAYPPLWNSAGSVPAGGYPVGANGLTTCPYTPGVWDTNVNGTSVSGAQYSIFTGTQLSDGSINTVGYANPTYTGQQCRIGSTTYNIYVRTGRCADGYTGVGCTLQNAGNVILPVDGTCQILRNGNSFSLDSKDPDCKPQAGKSNPVPVFTQSNGTLSFVSKTDANGRPSVATASVNNGAASVTVSRPNVTTPTYTNDIVTSAAPDATTGAAPTTTTTSTNTAGIGPGSVAVSSTTTTSEVTVELPENLAKTQDIAAVKTAIEGLKETPADPFNPNPGTAIAPDATDAVTGAIGDGSELPSVFSFSPTLPGSVNAPNIAFRLAGNSVNMDISAWIGYVRNFLGVLLYTVTPFVVFSIISGRKQED